jgi:hypothetical protein
MPHCDGTPTIEELHRTYNGPIPKHFREAANAGGFTRLAVLKAKARVRFRHQYLRTNRAIRRECAENPDYQNERQTAANARDLDFAMRGLLDARAELRAARSNLAAIEIKQPPEPHGSCEGHPMPQPGMVDA